MIKSAIPVVIIAAHFWMGKESFSWTKLLIVFILSLGVALTSFGDLTFAFSGFLFALAAMLTASAKILLMEKMLTGEQKLTPLMSLAYLSPISCVALTIPFGFLEARNLFESSFLLPENAHYTIALLAGGAGLAFILNLSALLTIASTSGLTLCVVGIVRLMFIIGFTSFFFADYKLTLVNELGVCGSMIGVVMYNYIRLKNIAVLAEDKNSDSRGEENSHDILRANDRSIEKMSLLRSEEDERSDVYGVVDPIAVELNLAIDLDLSASDSELSDTIHIRQYPSSSDVSSS